MPVAIAIALVIPLVAVPLVSISLVFMAVPRSATTTVRAMAGLDMISGWMLVYRPAISISMISRRCKRSLTRRLVGELMRRRAARCRFVLDFRAVRRSGLMPHTTGISPRSGGMTDRLTDGSALELFAGGPLNGVQSRPFVEIHPAHASAIKAPRDMPDVRDVFRLIDDRNVVDHNH